MGINCLQLNCHHSKAVMANLRQNLLKPNTILLLQEPHLYKDSPTNLGHLQSYCIGTNPRAVVAATPDIQFWPDPSFSSADMATVHICSNGKRIILSSIYLDILADQENFFPPGFCDLVDHCSNQNIPLILALDSNAHSCLWGVETNNRGKTLFC